MHSTGEENSNTDKNEIYIQLLCTICAEVCHRAVRLSCCNIQACRGCATKELIGQKKCWHCGIMKSTKDLINDEPLRQRVDNFKKMAAPLGAKTAGQTDKPSLAKSATSRSRSNIRKSTNTTEKSANELTNGNADVVVVASKARSKSRTRLNAISQSVSQLPAAPPVQKPVTPGKRGRSKSNSRLNHVPIEVDPEPVKQETEPINETPRTNHRSLSRSRSARGGLSIDAQGVNDENLAPMGSTSLAGDTPKTMSRFSGRSRLKKFIESPQNSPTKSTNLDLLTIGNTKWNGGCGPGIKLGTEVKKEGPDFSTPSTVGLQPRPRRIGWSEVNVFYFPRRQGFSSVPRDGGNTLGMEIRHTDYQSWSIQGEPDLHVKRKLFTFGDSTDDTAGDDEEMSSRPDNEPVEVPNPAPSVYTPSRQLSRQGTSTRLLAPNHQLSSSRKMTSMASSRNLSTVDLPKVHSCPSKLSEIVKEEEEDEEITFAPEQRLSVEIDDEDEEISFKPLLVKPLPPLVDLSSEDSTSSISSTSSSTDLIPSKVPDKPSSPFKRSLSRSYSEDSFAISATAKSNTDPPRKALKPCTRLMVNPDEEAATPSFSSVAASLPPATPFGLESIEGSPSWEEGGGDIDAAATPASLLTPAARSSRVNGGKPPGRILKSGTKTDLLKSATKTDLLRKSALKSCHRQGLVRLTRSSVDLKQQEQCDIPATSKFMRPDNKLVKSISRNCLRSFQEFHTSPEAAAAAAGTSVQPPAVATPARTLARSAEEDGGKQEESPKGECGARGLTPLTNRARINLLKAEGMVLEKGEAEEIKLIRESRQNCGCSCKGFCDPVTCWCIQNEIECQSERPGFPCGCTHADCGNPNGRRAYDRTEVELHYIQTIHLNSIMDISGS